MKEYEIGDFHSFRVTEAIAYGVEAATLLQNIRFWCRTNMANKRHCYDGFYWTYNSAEAYSKLFPYIAPRTIANHLKKLVDTGILKKGDYSEDRYARPNYYTIPSEFAAQATNDKIHSNLPNELPEFTNRLAENYQSTSSNLPIDLPEFTNVNTDINAFINTDVNTDVKASAPKKKSAFVKPTINELVSFCNENNLTIDPNAFIDHYESNGWKIGSTKMADWKATARNWQRRENPKPTYQPIRNGVNYDQRKPSLSDIASANAQLALDAEFEDFINI